MVSRSLPYQGESTRGKGAGVGGLLPFAATALNAGSEDSGLFMGSTHFVDVCVSVFMCVHDCVHMGLHVGNYAACVNRAGRLIEF
jgi:hypothetical protein